MDRFTLAMWNGKHQRGTELVATDVALSERLVFQRHRGMDVSRIALKSPDVLLFVEDNKHISNHFCVVD